MFSTKYLIFILLGLMAVMVRYGLTYWFRKKYHLQPYFEKELKEKLVNKSIFLSCYKVGEFVCPVLAFGMMILATKFLALCSTKYQIYLENSFLPYICLITFLSMLEFFRGIFNAIWQVDFVYGFMIKRFSWQKYLLGKPIQKIGWIRIFLSVSIMLSSWILPFLLNLQINLC